MAYYILNEFCDLQESICGLTNFSVFNNLNFGRKHLLCPIMMRIFYPHVISDILFPDRRSVLITRPLIFFVVLIRKCITKHLPVIGLKRPEEQNQYSYKSADHLKNLRQSMSVFKSTRHSVFAMGHRTLGWHL